MNPLTPSRQTAGPLTRILASLFAAWVGYSRVLASTNQIGGGVSLAYGPPNQVLQRESFARGSSASSVSSGVNSVASNGNYTQVGRVDARAGRGSVGISASTSYEMTEPRYTYSGNYEAVQASGTAKAVFTDVIVSGPASGSVSTRLRMHFSGTLDTTSVPSIIPDGSAGSASISFGIYVNNTLVGWGNRVRDSLNGGAPGGSSSGLLQGFSGGSITTPSFNVPLNTRVTLAIELSASATSRLDGHQNGMSSASSRFYNSLSFATEQPVFDLPPGFAANSPDGGIQDNRFTPVPTDPPVLGIQSLTNAVILFWPGDYESALLERATDLLDSWVGVPVAPVLTNSHYVLRWTNDTNQAFFRLRVP